MPASSLLTRALNWRHQLVGYATLLWDCQSEPEHNTNNTSALQSYGRCFFAWVAVCVGCSALQQGLACKSAQQCSCVAVADTCLLHSSVPVWLQ